MAIPFRQGMPYFIAVLSHSSTIIWSNKICDISILVEQLEPAAYSRKVIHGILWAEYGGTPPSAVSPLADDVP